MSNRYTDMLGREIVLDKVPKRIVSLVPSQTELLYDLGLDDEVVGITKFCIHPEAWFRTKPRVGGTKKIDPVKVAALQPDLIIANKEENVKEQIEALENIAPVWVSDIKDLDDALRMIREVGQLTGRAEAGAEMAARTGNDFRELDTTGKKDVRVAYCIWREPWIWAGGDTFIADMIRRTGAVNALGDLNRYPEVSLQNITAYRPDTVLLSSEPYPFKEKHVAELKQILPSVHVMQVDGELFSWYGSRLLHSAAYLNSLILRPDEQ